MKRVRVLGNLYHGWAGELVRIAPSLEGQDPAALVDLVRQWVRHRDSLRLPGEPWGVFRQRVFPR